MSHWRYELLLPTFRPLRMAVSGGARVSGARGQMSCLSPPPSGHPSSDLFRLIDSFASYSAFNPLSLYEIH
jgi:hypothetical protein